MTNQRLPTHAAPFPDKQPLVNRPFFLEPGPSTPPSQPTLEFFLRQLALNGYTPNSEDKLIATFAKYKAKLWVKMWDAAMKSLNLKPKPPDGRLLYYLRMSIVHPEWWEEWQAKIPTGKYGYEQHWADYQELRLRGVKGDFGSVLQLACIIGRLPPELLQPEAPFFPPAAAPAAPQLAPGPFAQQPVDPLAV